MDKGAQGQTRTHNASASGSERSEKIVSYQERDYNVTSTRDYNAQYYNTPMGPSSDLEL